MATKKQFFKLGENSDVFVDTRTGVKIAGNQPVEISEKTYKASKRLQQAAKNGHVVEIPESEFKAMMKSYTASVSEEEEEEKPKAKKKIKKEEAEEEGA